MADTSKLDLCLRDIEFPADGGIGRRVRGGQPVPQRRRGRGTAALLADVPVGAELRCVLGDRDACGTG